MTTYYHVASPEYGAGEDLICRQELEDLGCAPAWHWPDADPGNHAWVVCLWRASERDEAEFMLEDMPGSRLLRVEIPEDADDIDWTEVYEGSFLHPQGYSTIPAVEGRIPARYITVEEVVV